MTTSEDQLQELRDSYQEARSRIVNPDYHDSELNAKLQAEARWEQIGAWEHVARRRYRLASRFSVDHFYHGPEATTEERIEAYGDFLDVNSHLSPIFLDEDEAQGVIARALSKRLT